MIRFILNDKTISTDLPPGTVLLDLIRYNQHLTGTKIGCREGDCGACTVLIGELVDGNLRYQSMTSCLVPIGNVDGRHVVTVEGINLPADRHGMPGELNPVQQAMADEGATQCGFCTPGFVMSLAGFCLSDNEPTYKNAIAAVDGNICRCTGYKSIERAAARLVDRMKERKDEEPAIYTERNKILPAYFTTIKNLLQNLQNGKSNHEPLLATRHSPLVAGGTDLYVQKHDELTHADLHLVFNDDNLKGIRKEGTRCIIGAASTVTDLLNSEIINRAFPNFHRYTKLVSSTPIRNMATVAGNFINASPIGDLTIFFLALDAEIELVEKTARSIPLQQLYKGYKDLDKKPNEYIREISFELPDKHTLFHFEKVSKRMHLDIASVNSAICLKIKKGIIDNASISAGGVGPIPMYLEKASAYLKGKQPAGDLMHELIEIVNMEISPISDARGSKEYKRLLLGQLIKAHFISLFPEYRKRF